MSTATDDVFRYMEKADALRKLLADLEWCGRAQGQGYGTQGSGGGRFYDACPACHGVHPSARHEFSTVGHRPDCRLALAIRREAP